MIRSAGLRGLRATVAELGGDAEALARASGVPVRALDADDVLVPETAMGEVLELAARQLDCPDLGLRVAGRQDLGMLGPLAVAIQNSPTVGDALDCTVRYLHVHARSLSLRLEPDPYRAPGVVGLSYTALPGVPLPAQGLELSLGFVHRSLTFLLDGPYGLRSVELPHRPGAPLERYEEFFGVPVRVRRPAAMLRVPLSLRSRPLGPGDERLRQLALAFLAQEAPPESASTTHRVRGALEQCLGTTPPEVGTVARLLTLHPRTLQRRLAAEGTTFARVLDEARRQAAFRYLTGTDMPMGQVAALLGLSEQSALSRCCRRWWGTTPRAVRRYGVPGSG